MDFNRFCELFPNAGFVKVAPFNEEELFDENLRKANKVPLNSLKDPLNCAQAKNWASKNGRLGWIVPKGYIVIDVDNKDSKRSSEVTETLLNNHSVKYLSNYSKQGTHFIFHNTSEIMKGKGQFQGYINHIGIQADGRADGKGYIILPVNDQAIGRSWGKWDINEVDDLPFWLRPLRVRREDDTSFIDMPDGGGNEALFKLRGAHSGPNLVNEEESIECLKIINYEIWDEPMSDEAFNSSVARPMEKTYGNMQQQDGTGPKKGENEFRLLAETIHKKYNLITVVEYVYKWEGGIHKKLELMDIMKMIHDEDPNLSMSQRKEVLEFIRLHNPLKGSDLDTDDGGIPVNNGYLDFFNLELREPDPTQYNTIKIDIDYNPNVEFSERIDNFMKLLCKGDPDKMDLCYQLAGYSLLRRNKLQKFAILTGGGGTGKSTFTNLIKRMFRVEHVGSVSLGHFDNDYYLATLLNVMVNVDDDASSKTMLEDAGRFKSIVAGMEILVRQIYGIPIKMISTAFIIANSNGMPKIKDNSDGLYRRMLIIELNNKVENPDIDFEKKITKLDMEYFLVKAVEGLHKVLKNGNFGWVKNGIFVPAMTEDKLRQRFQVQQSSIHQWIKFCNLRVADLLQKGLMSLHGDYKMWCSNASYPHMAFGTFEEMIVPLYNLRTEYDRGQRDQIVIGSDRQTDYCPFDLTKKEAK